MLHCPQCNRYFAPGISNCPADGSILQAEATIAEFRNTQLDPLAGRVFNGKYRIDEIVGTGGMGTVYRATHLLIDRPVAIKVLHPRFVENEAALQRFRREARAAGRLQHNNAVAVTDFGETEDGLVYIVMELLEGHDLSDLLVLDAPLDPARAVGLMLEIAAAVAAAHEAGVIHRDLKPSNIFIVEHEHKPVLVKVLDFGIAKLAAESTEGDTLGLTQTGMMIGTPRYMSPEQCDGAPLTPAADVYSLGIILYEMLTGMTPFTGPSPLAIAVQHSSKPPRPPRELRPEIPAELEALVLHALAKQPQDRPADAGEFRRELYALAQRLGFDHTNEFHAPPAELLREAGTETPSGRLVLDLERLRAGRAEQQQQLETTVLAADTAGAAPAATDEIVAAQTELEGPLPPPPFTRLRIYIRERQEQHQIRRLTPLALAGAFVLLMLLVGGAALMQPTLTDEPASMKATSDTAPQPAPPQPTPPEATASPTPAATTPTPTPEEANANRKREENKPARRAGRQQQPPRQQPQGSKLGKVVKGLKKIFKKPF